MLSNASLRTKVLSIATLIGLLIAIIIGSIIYVTNVSPVKGQIGETGFWLWAHLALSVIAISPIMQDKEFLGMVAMMQGFASVRKSFTQEKGGQWILLVDKRYVKERYGSMPIIDKNTSFNDDYILAKKNGLRGSV